MAIKLKTFFYLSAESLPVDKRITRRQAEYVQGLAEKTGSTVPTERQLLDFCTPKTVAEVIDQMKVGNTIILKHNEG